MTKSIVTKEECKRDVMREILSTIPTYVILMVTGILMSFMWRLPWEFAMERFAMADGDMLSIVVGGVGVLFAALMLAIPIIIAVFIVEIILTFIKAKKGDFYIVRDELSYKVADEPVRSYRGRHRYQDVFYFCHNGRYEVTIVDKSAFEYSSDGDIFFLLMFGNRKPKIMRVFNSKVYDIEPSLEMHN